MVELALYISAFIVLSGLMAAIEAAVLSISQAEVEELRLRGAWGANALQRVTENITQALSVLVIFTNTINVLGPILAGRKAMQLYGDFAIAIVTAILTLGTIVFSEIIPKSLGTHYAPFLSRWASPLIQIWIVALYPLVSLLEWLSSLFKSGVRRIGTEAQIRSLTTIGRRAGYIEGDEGQLIRRAFLLNDRLARDVMTPRADMIIMFQANDILASATQVLSHPYSRYPVCGKNIDDITGMVMSYDILKAIVEGRGREPVSNICRPGHRVTADMRSNDLLAYFREAQVHQTVVHDGTKTVGLVSLKDVLEQLVGDIREEKLPSH